MDYRRFAFVQIGQRTADLNGDAEAVKERHTICLVSVERVDLDVEGFKSSDRGSRGGIIDCNRNN